MSSATLSPANSAAAASAPSTFQELPKSELILLTLAFSLGLFMEVLDTSIANVAVPTIAGNFGASTSQGTWVISSYGLAAAMAVPMTGWIARRFGEVRVFTYSVLLFVLTSMLCGMSQNLHMLVVSRFLQGLVSGPMVPLAQTLLMAIYPPAKRGIAMAAFVMTTVTAPIVGPMLGGFIVDHNHWAWIFYINVPVGLFSAWVVHRLMRKRESTIVRQPVDMIGFILLVLGVGSLQLMLDNGNDFDWFSSTTIVVLALVAAVCLAALVIWELTDEHPIVDLSLFKMRNFSFGVLAMSMGYMAFFAITVLLPLWLQTLMGYSATHAGIATAPIGILIIILAPILGANAHRLNLRLVGSIGFLVFGLISYWFSTFNLDTTMTQVLWPRFLQGIGAACFFMPINTIVFSGIPPEKMAAASGLAGFFRTISGSIGTALLVTTWDHREKVHEVRLSENLWANNPARLDLVNSLQSMGVSQDAANSILQGTIAKQALMMATSEIFWVMSIMFLALIGFIWLTRPVGLPSGAAGAGGH
jgi:DHA2 family multidrug resistance protein